MDPNEFDQMMRDMIGDKLDGLTATKVEPLSEVLDAVKKDMLAGFDKVAADHGVPRSTIIGELIGQVIIGVMLRRNVRKGNIAKTVYWAAAALTVAQNYNARLLREQLKRQSKRL